MRYKVFLIAFVSLLLAIPQNSFTCGPTEDPYDYYTSFFSNSAGAGKAYQPFYYTGLLTFYDDWNQDSTRFDNDRIIDEWKEYTKASQSAAVQLVYLADNADLMQVKETIIAGKPLPKFLSANNAAKNLVKEKDLPAVTYLAFAKKVEPVSTAREWNDSKNDSLLLNKYIDEADQSFTAINNVFIKNKWAFQRCKLAFYNNRFADCIRWYNEVYTDENRSAVMQLALSYKGGSQFRLGQAKEAAYSFSKAFPLSAQNKKQNFLGFLWATENCKADLISSYTQLCKNNPEKANMMALFGLYGSSYKLDILQKVYALNPASALLPLLATREISKLEEQYFTPLLGKEKGGKALYVSWGNDDATAKPIAVQNNQVMKTATQFETMMADATLAHRGLYGAGAAYLYFMMKDYTKASALSTQAKKLTTEPKIKDQLALNDLLIVANEAKQITPDKEAQMLPAIQWLVEKAKQNKDYALFCRNFFSEILAQRYEQQNDAAKAALSYGMADLKFIKGDKDEYYYSYPPATDFLHNEMSTASLLKLYEFTTSPSTEVVKYLVQNASFKRDQVIDVIGTSFLRDRNYSKAIEWLSKAGKLDPLIETQYNYNTGKERTVNVDPLYDYINDWQRLNKPAVKAYTKLTLAQKLLELQTKADRLTAREDGSKTYYTLASALYNMSYYGNSWNAVAYFRPSANQNDGVYKQPWEREYFGVYKAKDYYQKAYDAATDKEFKASCLFMIAKCLQRQIIWPSYDYKYAELSDKKMAEVQRKYRRSRLFAQFKTEFGSTKFYQYAYNRCSYLRDYVERSGSAKPSVTKPKRQ